MKNQKIMSLLETVIKANSLIHAKEIIQWWKDQGIDISGFNGSSWQGFPYYGLDSHGIFDIFTEKTVISRGCTVIELPVTNPLPKRGDKVLVWDDEEKYAIKERVFLAYIEGADCPVITVELECEEEFLNNEQFSYDVYQNYKPIPKKDTSLVELTMDEALEKLAKLENVDVARLRIKK